MKQKAHTFWIIYAYLVQKHLANLYILIHGYGAIPYHSRFSHHEEQRGPTITNFLDTMPIDIPLRVGSFFFLSKSACLSSSKPDSLIAMQYSSSLYELLKLINHWSWICESLSARSLFKLGWECHAFKLILTEKNLALLLSQCLGHMPCTFLVSSLLSCTQNNMVISSYPFQHHRFLYLFFVQFEHHRFFICKLP